MKTEAPPYGRSRIGRVEPGPGRTDAQAIDVRREGQLAGRAAETYQGVPPVKKAPWEWYIPLYFWIGGLASGSWLAAAAEDLAGENDRTVVRTGRYVALGSTLAGTALLIADLGRPERFLNMLRVMRPTSAMSIGSWALTTFGPVVGAGAMLQAAEDGLLGERPRLARLSRGALGRAVHLVGIPAALFVGGYAGALLSSTATPAWARRGALLSPLFLASSTSNGMAVVSAAAGATGRIGRGAQRRLARAEAVALGGELALLAVERLAPRLPSQREEPRAMKLGRALTIGAGVALPLALSASRGARPAGRRSKRATRWSRSKLRRGPRREARSRTGLLAAGLTLAGGLALRFLTVLEGYRSADTPQDTWAYADRGRGRAAGRAEAGRTAATRGGHGDGPRTSRSAPDPAGAPGRPAGRLTDTGDGAADRTRPGGGRA